MRWATPSEMLEILKTALGLLCYAAMIFGAFWLINTIATEIQAMIKRRKKQKYERAERERLEAWRKYNERMEILSDPDYYGEI